VNVVLWIVQGLLAALFVFSGVMKFVMSVEEMTKQIALPGAFLHFIGVAEILGGLGLVLPGLFGIRPGLTPLAAAGLVVIMIGAVVISLQLGVAMAVLPFTVGVLTALVAYARWRVVPLRTSARRSALQPEH
jgi:hypothetical protein